MVRCRLNVLFKQHGGDSCKRDCPVWQFCALVSWWLQLSNQHHSLLLSVCLPHWMLCRVWLACFLIFFQLLKTCHFDWFQPIWRFGTGIKLLWYTFCIFFPGLLCNVSVRVLADTFCYASTAYCLSVSSSYHSQ